MSTHHAVPPRRLGSAVFILSPLAAFAAFALWFAAIVVLRAVWP